jgi:hypothetical protein
LVSGLRAAVLIAAAGIAALVVVALSFRTPAEERS